MLKTKLEKLKKLKAHYKALADYQASQWGPDAEEVKAYDDLAASLDFHILDVMVEIQEEERKKAIVA